MLAIPIKERRHRPHANRPFERRTNGADDVRMIEYFEELGERKVRAQLSRGGFAGRNAVAQKWLKGQGSGGGKRFLRAIGLF